MIERLHGTIVAHNEKTITILVAGGVGYAVHVADHAAFSLESEMTVLICSQWNTDKGMVLYGFETDLARSVFGLIITCPKIGPAVALALLRQSTPARIIQDITTSNEKGLSSCVGVGPKKAEQIIHALKNKMGHLVATQQELAGSSAADWHHLQDALASLHYSRSEIADAVQYLTSEYADTAESPVLNVLLRKALSYLSSSKSMK